MSSRHQMHMDSFIKISCVILCQRNWSYERISRDHFDFPQSIYRINDKFFFWDMHKLMRIFCSECEARTMRWDPAFHSPMSVFNPNLSFVEKSAYKKRSENFNRETVATLLVKGVIWRLSFDTGSVSCVHSSKVNKVWVREWPWRA